MTASREPAPSPEDATLWRAADRALDALLDVEADARPATLAAMDLPQAVRARVERLLAADALLGPAIDATCSDAPPASPLRGRRAGRWVIGEEIGRGGMSIVHAAEAVDAPGQRAAIKVLAAATFADGGGARLERERRALSRLGHPNIVPLLDAGLLDDGTPWIATALVDGMRIDAWCDAQALDVAGRVALMRHVADAVAHAHRALIVHRDLKPANVMVDREGHVRLLDFGIAGLVSADGERTRTLVRALTPDYAAPEQFSDAPAGTAMDVYGLGALLYRLLCGRPPPRRSGADETIPPPSSAIGDAGAGAGGGTTRTRAVLRGDLDAIVLKALEYEPQRRYAGAGEFGEDLARWLDGRPVSAQRPTLRYRTGKFVRRHRGSVAAAAIAVLAACAGVAATLWQAQRAAAAAVVAREESARAEAVSGFLIELFTAAASGRIRDEVPTTDELLAIGAQRARDPGVGPPAVRATLLETVGRVYMTQDRHVEAEAALRESLQLRARDNPADAFGRAHAEATLARVLTRRGEHDAALVLSAAVLARVGPATRPTLPLREDLVDVRVAALNSLGRYDEALVEATTHAEDVARLAPDDPVLGASAAYSVAIVHNARGAPAAALALLSTARARAATVTGHWELRLSIDNALATALAGQDRHEEALALRRETLDLVRAAYPADHPRVGQTLNNLTSDLDAVGLAEEALAMSDAALDILTARLGATHPSTAAAWNNRGMVLAALGRPREALDAYDRAARGLPASAGLSDWRRLRLDMNRAEALLAGGDAAMAIDILVSLQAAIESDPSPRHALRWHGVHALARLARGEFDAAARSAAAAEDAAASLSGGDTAGSGRAAVAKGLAAQVAAARGDGAARAAALARADAALRALDGRLDRAALTWIERRTALLAGAGERTAAIAALDQDITAATAALGADDARVRRLQAWRAAVADGG